MATKVDYIPKGYHNVVPYLVCADVQGLIKFLEETFAAKMEGPAMKGPDGSIAHAEIMIGNSHVMMGGAKEGHPPVPMCLYVYVEDTDAAYNRALKSGATSLVEPADQFYGDRNAGVKDNWGNMWYMATHKEDLTPEEIQKRASEHYAACKN